MPETAPISLAQLRALLAAQEVRLSDSELKRLRGNGLVPAQQVHMAGERGSVSLYPPWAVDQIELVERLGRSERRFRQLRVLVRWHEGWVDPDKLRKALIEMVEGFSTEVRQLAEGAEDELAAVDNVASALRSKPGHSRALRLLRRRLDGQNLAVLRLRSPHLDSGSSSSGTTTTRKPGSHRCAPFSSARSGSSAHARTPPPACRRCSSRRPRRSPYSPSCRLQVALTHATPPACSGRRTMRAVSWASLMLTFSRRSFPLRPGHADRLRRGCRRSSLAGGPRRWTPRDPVGLPPFSSARRSCCGIWSRLRPGSRYKESLETEAQGDCANRNASRASRVQQPVERRQQDQARRAPSRRARTDPHARPRLLCRTTRPRSSTQ